MTIKEIEELSGMTRANIRFYEKEKLICPARDANGYRNYSETDLDNLKRIRLLRILHMSLEEIREAADGISDLESILKKHLDELKRNQNNLEQCFMICSKMCEAHLSYSTFDAQYYLNLSETLSGNETEELKQDVLPKVTSPWVRYFARDIDYTIWYIIWYIFLAVCLDVNPDFGLDPKLMLLDLLFSNIIILITEPLFLAFTGTTPGKFVFGLTVTSSTGNRLSIKEALQRTFSVMRHGYGFNIPVYEYIRLYKSYKKCKSEDLLPWEQESILHLDTGRFPLGVLTYFIAGCASLLIYYLMIQTAAVPPNRGALTVSEFSENYNDSLKYYDIDYQMNLPYYTATKLFAGTIDSPVYLNSDGSWEKDTEAVYLDTANYAPLPSFQYEEENGIMTGMKFTYTAENSETKISSYGDIMSVAVISYLCARDEYNLVPETPGKIHSYIRNKADLFEDFVYTEAGVSVICSFDYSGYDYDMACLTPAYGQDNFFSVTFSIEQIDKNRNL